MNLKGRWVAYRGDQCVGGNSALRSRCSRVRPSGGRREPSCLCRLSVCLSFCADVSIFTSGARAPARVLRFPRDFRERIA